VNWSRLAISAFLPLLLALPVAALLWRRRQTAVGNVIGAGVVLLCTVMFMALEFGDAVHYRFMCSEQNLPCGPSKPSDFVRIFTFAMVGMVEVMVVFLVGASVETRNEQRHRAPEWRR
jgi:Na+(H+)/acetate symporter ActP